MARLKSTSAVYSRVELKLIAKLQEIAFQQKTTISKLIKKAIEYSLTHNVLVAQTPSVIDSTSGQKRITEKPAHPPKKEIQEAEGSAGVDPRATDPAYLREILINNEIDEQIVEKLPEATILGLANATIEELTRRGIPPTLRVR